MFRIAGVRNAFRSPLLRRQFNSKAGGSGLTAKQKLASVAAGSIAGLAVYHGLSIPELHAEAKSFAPSEYGPKMSIQHLQVQSSLEFPGVYAWGDNSGRVVAPDSDELVIKTPRRIPFFNGVVLRDLNLSNDVGVAVDTNGDVLQWGRGYSENTTHPEPTLTGKQIQRVVLSKDKIIALAKDSSIYTFPISKDLQKLPEDASSKKSSWIGGSGPNIAYRLLKPNLGYTERITDIAAGREHLLVLTSSGRVFSSAAAFSYPTKGQLGIPGLTWNTRPSGQPVDALHEIEELRGHRIKHIAAGDYHSVCLDRSGDLYTFGDNAHGQLGFPYHPDLRSVDTPTPLSLSELYPNKRTKYTVDQIAAGGLNTYLTVDVVEDGKKIFDVLSCGAGIYGNLGNGRWTHVQGPPIKVKALSGLSEYSEASQMSVPIRLRSLNVGATHVAAVMDNNTRTSAKGSTVSDSNYGADVLWWGNNEFYQLGTGKRNNSNVPIYIQPLDGVPAELAGSTFTGSSSRGDTGERASGIIGGVGRQESGRQVKGIDQVHRFQITPEGAVKGIGKAAQTVVCGRGNTGVYMRKL